MKKTNTKPRVTSFALALTITVIGMLVDLPAIAGELPRPAPGKSAAFGKDLAAWQELFWRWAFGEVSLPVDENANPVAGGNVVLMQFPATPGDGTPGSLEVTLNAGQAFVLPLWNILGPSYDDGTPDDPALSLSVFQTLDITFKIDGVTLISSNNVMDYYTSLAFAPEIPLPPEWSPYLAVVWLQGTGVVQPPLSAGQHTITLDAKNTIPVIDGKGNAYVFEYHNTWNVTVKAGN